MSTCKDSAGKEWEIRITVGRLRQVRENPVTKIDLRKSEAWADLSADIEKAAAVAWVAADGPTSGVSFNEFLDRLSDVKQCAALCEAVVEAARDFFQTPPETGGAADQPT